MFPTHSKTYIHDPCTEPCVLRGVPRRGLRGRFPSQPYSGRNVSVGHPEPDRSVRTTQLPPEVVIHRERTASRTKVNVGVRL